MNAETWERVKDAFAIASSLQPEEGQRFIEERFADDDLARNEAMAMLRASTNAPHFLDHPVIRIEANENSRGSVPELRAGDILSERFRITHLVAEGGMGKVYSATDLELSRTVAVKAVRAKAGMTERLGLLLRQEAKLVSKLNHPGICILHDVRQQGGLDYLIMELVEGETLARRLSRKALSLAETVKIALDLLSALSYAHRHGVIHRDLKPGNIMLTRTGTKLLDFGIAKLKDSEALEIFAAGTPIYMAPEQLSENVSDIRSDIYSFGLVFLTLLTGSAPESRDVSLQLARIPEPFHQIVTKCLAEDPGERWQDAGDLRSAIELASPSPLELARYRKSLLRLKIAAVSLTLLAAAAIVGTTAGTRAPASTRMEFEISPPKGYGFLSIEVAGPPVISPDGRTMVFAAGYGEQHRLWLRRFDSAIATPLEGTESASHPFWSPDSESIAFFARGQLMVMELGSRKIRMICTAEKGRSGTWNRDGVIVFSPSYTTSLFRVPSNGGEDVVAVPLTNLDARFAENSHRWPVFLPDGKHVLFVIRSRTPGHSGLYSTSLDGGSPRRIGRIESSVVYARQPDGSGYLLFVQGPRMMAQPFDADTLTLSDEPVPVADLGFVDDSTTRIPASVSDAGTLVYGGGRPEQSHIIWYDTAGKQTAQSIYPWRARYLRLSPDAQSLALEKIDPFTGVGDLLVEKIASSKLAFFTDAPISAFAPIWSPNGLNLAFVIDKGGEFQLVTRALDGTPPQVLLSSPKMIAPTDWTADGSLLFEKTEAAKQRDLQVVNVGDPKRQLTLLGTDNDERYARVSRDGNWMAYTSNQSRTENVYVRPFRGPGPVIQVSSSGGTQPVWGNGSTDIFFLDRDHWLCRSRIDFRSFKATPPQRLFLIPVSTDSGKTDSTDSGRAGGWEYEVAANGNRIVAALPKAPSESRKAIVVQGWSLPQKPTR